MYVPIPHGFWDPSSPAAGHDLRALAPPAAAGAGAPRQLVADGGGDLIEACRQAPMKVMFRLLDVPEEDSGNSRRRTSWPPHPAGERLRPFPVATQSETQDPRRRFARGTAPRPRDCPPRVQNGGEAVQGHTRLIPWPNLFSAQQAFMAGLPFLGPNCRKGCILCRYIPEPWHSGVFSPKGPHCHVGQMTGHSPHPMGSRPAGRVQEGGPNRPRKSPDVARGSATRTCYSFAPERP
jgi:hypothetical protein